MRSEAMMIHILVFCSWIATICVVADIQLHPIRTEDLQNIVDSVKKDVDRHLKTTSSRHHKESAVLQETEKSIVVEDIDKLINIIQDSMQEHLLKNLVSPSDEENSVSTENTFVRLGTESDFDHSSTRSTDANTLEPSSESHKIRIGSSKGVPGVNFPDYTDIPITGFTCSDKTNLPRFYADLDTGCQVFHVCLPNRRESFLCPMGTIFNQALGVCDYWYNSNCSLAPYHYTVEEEQDSSKSKSENESSMKNALLEEPVSSTTQKSDSSNIDVTADILSFVAQFMPVKAKIIVYPETSSQRSKIVASASIGKRDLKSRHKNLSSKLKRVPRSIEHIEPQELDIEKLKYEIRYFRTFEMINNVVEDIKNDKTWSKLSKYADGILNYFKRVFKGAKMPDVEPGSELHEYDISGLEIIKKRYNFFKDVIIFIAKFMYWFDTKEKFQIPEEVSEEVHELQPFKPTPLTRLNPRFIVKPATEQMRERRSTVILNPLKLSHGDRLSICPGTKKSLLKNYVKRFKTKRG